MNMSSMILFLFLNPKYDIFGRLQSLINCKLEHSIFTLLLLFGYLGSILLILCHLVFLNYILLLIDVSS
jgi:hypothetical protein